MPCSKDNDTWYLVLTANGKGICLGMYTGVDTLVVRFIWSLLLLDLTVYVEVLQLRIEIRERDTHCEVEAVHSM